MSENAAIKILICQGTGGVSMGAKEVEAEFTRVINEKGVNATVGKRCDVIKTGCRGLCANDVLVDIITEEHGRITYDFVKPEEVEMLVDEHIVNKTVLEKRKAKPYYNTFVDQQMRVVMTGCGQINPEKLDAYLEEDGFKAIEQCVKKMNPASVIDEVKKAGLRGRGGGGVPTGMKWSFCAASPGHHKYIICNADEGDPGAFMDRSILEGDPYCIIEGMMIAGFAIGATAGYVYVRAEYPLAIERLQMALDVCYEKGYLGTNVMGLGFDFNLRIKKGAGAFVCGEETALMASIEGERGMPRPRPPFPAVKGLWAKPTNINNVETFANVRHIILRGAEWYASLGTETTKGTKIFAVTGKVKHTGLVEVPAGMTVSDVIYKVCGGIANNRKFKAVQAGGPSGGCIPAEILDTPVDYDSLIKAGAMMGSGGLVVMDETTCMVDVARFFLNFTRDESCGKCVPCRIGLKAMLDILERITEGRGQASDIETLLEMGTTIKKASLCGLGQTAPNPILSTIKYFRHEYEAHILDKRCPSNCCKELLLWQVVEEKCVKCGACLKACPVDAIKWEKGQVAELIKEKCTKCKSCYDACRFMAIE
ncbi:MAG: NADH-quinone oxidoreductase subunit NuoF [Geobacter sp.]|nr:NADH-quinone oxidoreductase subunit NuoF [Geobacter sp.]